MTAPRIAALALLVLGLIAVGVGVTVISLASPATLHCARSTRTCQLHETGLFGGAHDTTLALGSLHDSRTVYTAHRTGLTTRWLVTGPNGDIALGAPTDSTEEGSRYDQLAHGLQQFLRGAGPSFDAELAAINRHGWVVLALAGAFAVAAGIYLIRAR